MGSIYETEWTDQRIEILKRMWINGDSATQIAERLGHVSRNAVLGKVYRLGMSKPSGQASRSANSELNKRYATRPPAKVKNPPTARPAPHLYPDIVLKVVTAPAEPRSYLTRRFGECAWPVDSADHETRSCCAPITRGSFCADHAKRAYTAPPKPSKSAKDMKHYLRRAS